MRFALILSLLLAILAVVFALQNPAYMDVNLGPWEVRGSTALVMMVTFCIGVLVGVLATAPALMKRRKRIRHLERHAADVRSEETGTTREATADPADPTTKSDYRTE